MIFHSLDSGRVNQVAKFEQLNPSVARAGNGEAAVIWDGGTSLEGQFFTLRFRYNGGRQVFDTFRDDKKKIRGTYTLLPHIVGATANGGIIVAYQDIDVDKNKTTQYMQIKQATLGVKLSASLTLVGAPHHT